MLKKPTFTMDSEMTTVALRREMKKDDSAMNAKIEGAWDDGWSNWEKIECLTVETALERLDLEEEPDSLMRLAAIDALGTYDVELVVGYADEVVSALVERFDSEPYSDFSAN